jgi:hypothetical protein
VDHRKFSDDTHQSKPSKPSLTRAQNRNDSFGSVDDVEDTEFLVENDCLITRSVPEWMSDDSRIEEEALDALPSRMWAETPHLPPQSVVRHQAHPTVDRSPLQDPE